MFPSEIKELCDIPLPPFRDLRILLMPLVLGDNATVPYNDCIPMMDTMLVAMPQHKGKVVYLTIDQKVVEVGQTHRRPGLHVDGYPHTEADKRVQDLVLQGYSGIWAGGGHGGTWGGGGVLGGGNKNLYWWDGTGLLTAASVEGCVAWHKTFEGTPKVEGDCEHLREQCLAEEAIVLKANRLYWMSPGCVHESLPVAVTTKRTFVRLSLPSNCDWYEGCTPNPFGVKPTGKVNKRRRFMDV